MTGRSGPSKPETPTPPVDVSEIAERHIRVRYVSPSIAGWYGVTTPDPGGTHCSCGLYWNLCPDLAKDRALEEVMDAYENRGP